jgi:DNA processing protein
MDAHTANQSAVESDALLDRVRLSLVSGIGPRLYKALLDHFGSATAALSAPMSELRLVPGIGAKLSQAVSRAREEIDARQEVEYCRQQGIALVSLGEAGYPRMLAEISDAPTILYVQGELKPEDSLAIAIVGSRHATHYGLAQAERLAASLARAGLAIVSGLARGVDAAAHRGALSAGGRTIAVLGGGLAQIYPPEHKPLADEIAGHGAVVSEAPPRSQPLSGSFPQRNRIISGMSLGVIVVEASTHSGALITARHAMEQNREVFAVPGRVDNRMAHGCHRLLRDGAKLVESADDVLEELGPLVSAMPSSSGQVIHHPAELLLNELEQQVLQSIVGDSTGIDEIVATSGLSAAQVLSTLSVLEMRRLVRRISGNRVMRP